MPTPDPSPLTATVIKLPRLRIADHLPSQATIKIRRAIPDCRLRRSYRAPNRESRKPRASCSTTRACFAALVAWIQTRPTQIIADVDPQPLNTRIAMIFEVCQMEQPPQTHNCYCSPDSGNSAFPVVHTKSEIPTDSPRSPTPTTRKKMPGRFPAKSASNGTSSREVCRYTHETNQEIRYETHHDTEGSRPCRRSRVCSGHRAWG